MQVWEEFLLRLEQDLGVETVKKWLRSLKLLRYDACNLYLEAKDSFQALWFEEHIRPKVVASFVNNNHKKIRVHIAIATRQNQLSTASPKPNNIRKSPKEIPPFHLTFDTIDPLCTFENFIIHSTNEVTTRVLKENSSSFNPIYLFGSTGSGKTHLLMSLARQLSSLGKKVIYARTETFTHHVVSAIRNGEMHAFRQAYRNIDALLLDDVHVLARKGATQEELFHTFNTLHLNGQRIILASKCPPGELQEIEPRLISRFEWGIVLPLESPVEKELLPVLNQKAKALEYPLSPKVAEFLIEAFPSSPKAVIRALEALILRSHVEHDHYLQFKPMTMQLAKHYLADLLLAEKQHALSPEKIIQASAEQFGIKAEDILGEAQTRECTHPRQIAMFLCRHHLKLPFEAIGEIFGRDHSTVMSSVNLVKKSIDTRRGDYATVVSSIEGKFGR